MGRVNGADSFSSKKKERGKSNVGTQREREGAGKALKMRFSVYNRGS